MTIEKKESEEEERYKQWESDIKEIKNFIYAILIGILLILIYTIIQQFLQFFK